MVWMVNQPSATEASDSTSSSVARPVALVDQHEQRADGDDDRAEGDREDDPGRLVGARRMLPSGMPAVKRGNLNAGEHEIDQEETWRGRTAGPAQHQRSR